MGKRLVMGSTFTRMETVTKARWEFLLCINH